MQNTAGCAAAEASRRDMYHVSRLLCQSSGPGPEADYRAAFNGDLDSDEVP